MKPLVERAAFIRFKVTPGDMPEFRGVDQLGDCFPQGREHPLEPRVKEQRFLVAHKEVIELHIEVRNINREPEKVRGNFVDGGHASHSNGPERICKAGWRHRAIRPNVQG